MSSVKYTDYIYILENLHQSYTQRAPYHIHYVKQLKYQHFLSLLSLPFSLFLSLFRSFLFLFRALLSLSSNILDIEIHV